MISLNVDGAIKSFDYGNIKTYDLGGINKTTVVAGDIARIFEGLIKQ